MKTRRFLALLLIAALLIGVFLIWKVFFSYPPEADVWISIGPKGKNIPSLAIDPATPTTLYAGTNSDGVLKSTNGGGNWVNTGLTNLYVYTLAIDPATPTTLYAGTNSGAFKSTDSGRKWSAVNINMSNNISVYALAIDPVRPAILYAGTNGGAFKSTDGGKNWSAISTGLNNANVKVLAIDPAKPTTLYAGTNSGVFKSTDSGKKWSAVNTSLTAAYIYALVIDPMMPTTLYAGTDGGGVFKSTNGGGGWSVVNIGLTNTDVRAMAIDPKTPTTLYAGTKGGMFKSTNGGGNWSAVNTGLTDIIVLSLAIDPKTLTTLYAGTNGAGVFIIVAPVNLTVSKDGSGSGTVSSTPIGINCGSDCSETYAYNTSVTLTAIADIGSAFTGWGGACTGTGECVVAMTAVQSVTATFTLAPMSSYGAVISDGPWTSLPSGAEAGLALDKEGSALTLQSDMTRQVFVVRPDPNKMAFPNSVWNMEAHNGRLYLGYGDLWNNRGPVDIVSYDPLSGALRQEMLDIPEEQIGDWHTTVDGQLYVGGNDSQESWTFGSFYVNDGLGWQKRRTIYKGLHVKKVVDFQGRLYASYGTDETSLVPYAFILVSNDQGVTWTYEAVDQTPVQLSMVGDLETVSHATGKYLYGTFYVQINGDFVRKLYRFDGNVWEQVVISDPRGKFLPAEVFAFQGQLLVSGYVCDADGYWGSAVYALDGQKQTEVAFLRDSYILWDDCDIHDGWLYCIVQTYGLAPVSTLYRTANLNTWEKMGTVTLLPGASLQSMGFAHDRLYVGATNAGWSDEVPGVFKLSPTEVYTIENATLGWDADVPTGAKLSLQIRSTSVYSYIFDKPWVGPNGMTNTVFITSGTVLSSLHNLDTWLQVAIYKTPNSSGESPLVKWVTVQTSNGSTTLAVDEGPGLYTAANLTDTAEYTSPVFQLQEPISGGSLSFEGVTPPSTTLRFQVRSASTQDQLTQQQFVGPDGTPTTVYQFSGQALWTGHGGDTCIQYRARLASSDLTLAPFLRKVILATRNDRLDHFSIALDDAAPWVAGQSHLITVAAYLADGRLAPIYGKISLSAWDISQTQALPLQPMDLMLVNGAGTMDISLQQATPTRICAGAAGVTSCSSALNVQPGAAAVISVTTDLPSLPYPNWSPVGRVGQPFTLTLVILDRYRNIVPSSTATVRCERWQWKSEAQLFPPYTFQPSDQGSHQFPSAVVIENSGEWNLVCLDEADPRIAGTQTVNIQTTGITPSTVMPKRTKPIPPWDALDALSIHRGSR